MADVRNEKIKALDLALGQIDRQFGKGSVMKMGDKGLFGQIDVIPTGSISIDAAFSKSSTA